MAKVRFKQAGQLARAGGRGKAAVLAGLMLAGACATALAGQALTAKDFHDAQTPAERALLQTFASPNPGPSGFTVLGRKRQGPGTTAKLKAMTPALVAAIGRAEQRMADKQCGGKLQGDGYCGFDSDPVECSDGSELIGVHTLQSSKDRVLIATTRTGWDEGTGPSYKMKRVAGAWKLDGLTCGGADSGFNWK